MKKTLFLTLLLTFSTFVYSQNSKEETNDFFEQIQSRKIIENVYNNIKESIKTNEKELFESQDLKYENEEEIKIFHNFLDEEINLFVDDTHNEMIYKFSTKPKDSILKYISLAKENKNGVLEKSGFKKELESILKEKQSYLINDINLTLGEIRAKYNPLILKVIENGKETAASKIDLELFLNTKDEQNSKLSILNKDNSKIELPKNFDFELIESLTIKYLDKEYTVERFNKSMPKEIQELTSPLSKYCFEQLEKWTLIIDENNITLETRGSVGQERK